MCIAIECSYKLDQKKEFKFLCELCTFSQIRSQLCINSVDIRWPIQLGLSNITALNQMLGQAKLICSLLSKLF